MKLENINSVRIMHSGELLLILQSGGKASYQNIYREATGIIWDNENGGFRTSGAPRNWSYPVWFAHIVATAKSIGIELELSPRAKWQNVPEDIKSEITKSENKTKPKLSSPGIGRSFRKEKTNR